MLRHFAPPGASNLRVERRDRPDGSTRKVIVGHASVFDAWTELYRGRSFVIREIVRPGAFKNALAEGQDVRALFNHDPNFVLGRTTSGTLLLSEDAEGLHNEIEFPETQTVDDLVVTPMGRGDVSGQSFAFAPRPGGYRLTEYEGEDGRYHYDYELTDADLYDVSIVTYPAYKEASAAVRSAATAEEAIRALGLDRFEVVRHARSADGPAPEPPADPPAEEPPAAPDPEPASRAAARRARELQLAELGA